MLTLPTNMFVLHMLKGDQPDCTKVIAAGVWVMLDATRRIPVIAANHLVWRHLVHKASDGDTGTADGFRI